MDGPLEREKATKPGQVVASSQQVETSEQPDHIEKSPTRQMRWQQAHPIARWSHLAVQSALKKGIIVREPCAVCGAEKTDAHHPDHRRPLDIVWLCRRHHSRHHAAERKAGGK